MWEDEQYMIDNNPSSAEDIINMARDYDRKFNESDFHQTSVAAGILRKHGHTVWRNPDYI